jgi:H+-transporting ATPase
VRERRHLWSSRPSAWVVLSSAVDISIIALLGGFGILMHALPWEAIAALIAASAIFALALDAVKSLLLSRLKIV